MRMTTWIRLCIALSGASAGVVVGAAPVHGQSPAKAVESLLRYHLEGGARWRQDNPAFQAGGGLPS